MNCHKLHPSLALVRLRPDSTPSFWSGNRLVHTDLSEGILRSFSQWVFGAYGQECCLRAGCIAFWSVNRSEINQEWLSKPVQLPSHLCAIWIIFFFSQSCMHIHMCSFSFVQCQGFLFFFLRTSGIFGVFLNQCAIHLCICLDRGLHWWGFCCMHPLKSQCTQALEKPLFERLCCLCWAVYFAFFPHSSLALLWQLLFCMNYIPRGHKSPNSSSRFDSCLCD